MKENNGSNKNQLIFLIKEEIKDLIYSKRAIFIILILSLIFLIMHLSNNIQLVLFLILNPENRQNLLYLALYYCFFATIPFAALLISFDSISGEIQKKTIKFTAYITTRTRILVSKIISRWIILFSIILFAYIISVVYQLIKLHNINILLSIKILVFFLFYTFYFITLCTLLSTLSKNSGLSLSLITLAFIFFILLSFTKVNYFSPFYNYSIIYGSFIILLLKLIFAYFMVFLVYILLSKIILERMDL